MCGVGSLPGPFRTGALLRDDPKSGLAQGPQDTQDRVWGHTYLFFAFLPAVLSVRLRHRPVNLRKKKNSFPQVPFSLHTEVREEEKVLQISTTWKLPRFRTHRAAFQTGSTPPMNE